MWGKQMSGKISHEIKVVLEEKEADGVIQMPEAVPDLENKGLGSGLCSTANLWHGSGQAAVLGLDSAAVSGSG